MRRRPTIRSFDDFLDEAKTLPTGEDRPVSPRSQLEEHFFDVADKHGVFDEILGDEQDY